MDTTQLHSAIQAEQAAKAKLDALTKQGTDLEDQLAVSQSALDAAETELHQLEATEALGESKPAQTAAARKKHDELVSRCNGLRQAIAVLRQRVEQASNDWRAAQTAAETAARAVASELAVGALDQLRQYATLMSTSMQQWHDLHCTAVGARLTGSNQQRAHGVIDVLHHYGIRGVESMQIGNPTGNERLLPPQNVLAIADAVAAREEKAA